MKQQEEEVFDDALVQMSMAWHMQEVVEEYVSVSALECV
jgi:hypothetical protein